ncbi:putative serine racemase [Helianthus anomalus]
MDLLVNVFYLMIINGAFKFRGASNAVFSLDEAQAAKGVVIHSSFGCTIRGIPAYVVVPNNAPKCKVENVKRYGGHVIFSEATMKSRQEMEKQGII